MEDQGEDQGIRDLRCRIFGHIDVLAKDYVTLGEYLVCMRCGRMKYAGSDSKRVNWYWHRLIEKTRLIWKRIYVKDEDEGKSVSLSDDEETQK